MSMEISSTYLWKGQVCAHKCWVGVERGEGALSSITPSSKWQAKPIGRENGAGGARGLRGDASTSSLGVRKSKQRTVAMRSGVKCIVITCDSEMQDFREVKERRAQS